jgi:uncharacterized protein
MQSLIDIWLRRRWRVNPDVETYAVWQPVTVVTGASEGIGRALALEFAKLGNPILLVARRAEPLAETARLVEAAGGKAFTLATDLFLSEGVTAIDAALASRHAYCDVLVNNAAMGLAGPFVGHKGSQVVQLVDLNMRALTELMHRHLPGMLARGRGGIVNIASLGGYLPGPHQAAYYASKAYVISLTEAVATECRGMGVRICVVAPGPVDTPFHTAIGSRSAYYARVAGWTSADYVALRAFQGLRRGQTVIVPGLVFLGLSLVARVLPHPFLVPITAWLLKVRG